MRLAAATEEARAKREATWKSKRRLLEEDVLLLWERGMVPLAIAAKTGTTVTKATRILREAGIELPAYLTTVGGKLERSHCPKCQHPLPL